MRVTCSATVLPMYSRTGFVGIRKRSDCLILLALIGFCLPIAQRGQAQQLDRVAHYGQAITAVCAEGDYAYVGEGAALRVLDISDAAHPRARGKIGLLAYCYHVAKKDNYVFCAVVDRGMQVVDVSYPDSPTIVYTYPVSKAVDPNVWWSDLELVGNRLYVAAGGGGTQSGIHIFDVTDPRAPVLLGKFQYSVYHIEGIGVRGNYVYGCSRYGNIGIVVVDVSNPAAPTQAGFCASTPPVWDIFFDGALGYAACDSQDGMVIYDVTSPTNPVRRGSCDTPYTATNVLKYGGFAYVADMWDSPGVIVMNVGNPDAPTLASTLNVPGTALIGLYQNADRLFVTSQTDLSIFSLAVPGSPVLLGQYSSPDKLGLCWGITWKSGYLYVCNYRIGMDIYDAQDPLHLSLTGRIKANGEPTHVEVSGNHAFVSNWWAQNMDVIDVSNKANPFRTTTVVFPVAGATMASVASGNYLYVADSEAGVYVLDISNPASPQIRTRYDTAGSATDLALVGNGLLVADGPAGLTILNISNPLAPSLYGSIFGIGNLNAIATSGTIAVGCISGPTEQKIQTYNISNLSSPFVQGNAPAWFPSGVLINGSRAFVNNHKAGVYVYDISNPSSPAKVGEFDTEGIADGGPFAYDGRYMFQPDHYGGLNVFQFNSTNDPPSMPLGHCVLSYHISSPSVDPEGQPVTYTYRWSSDAGDLVVHGPTLSTTDSVIEWELVQTGETWTVTVTPNDGTQDGPAAVGRVKIVDAQAGVLHWMRISDVDLAVQKTATPGTVRAGELLTYHVVLTNQGPDTATSVTLVDTLPSTVTLVSMTAADGGVCHISGESVVAEWGTLAPSTSTSATIVVRPMVAGLLSNVVTVTCNDVDTDPADNSAVVSTLVNPPFEMWSDETFETDVTNPTPGGTTGWTPFSSYQIGQATDYDTVDLALRVTISTGTVPRINGWMTGNSEWLPYSAVSSDNYVRGKFYMFRSGQASTTDLNQVPNMRLRLSTRFAVNSILEVFNHLAGDSAGTNAGSELCPNSSPVSPSIYRVDLDPVDVPALNVTGEGVSRAFEAYSLESQENGSIEMAESVIGSYPVALCPDAGPEVLAEKVFAVSASDAGDLKVFNSATDGPYFHKFVLLSPGTLGSEVALDGSTDPAYLDSSAGVTLDTTLVPTNRVGLAIREFTEVGANSGRIRVERDRQYKVRWHVTSNTNANRNPQLRLRARSIKFMWSQKQEYGGALAAGNANNAIAQQALPGIGCLNPDQLTPGENGGWYTLWLHTPLSTDILVAQPTIDAQPGPGSTSNSMRDVKFGIDVIDTLSGMAASTQEAGRFTLDRIEIRSYHLIDD